MSATFSSSTQHEDVEMLKSMFSVAAQTVRGCWWKSRCPRGKIVPHKWSKKKKTWSVSFLDQIRSSVFGQERLHGADSEIKRWECADVELLILTDDIYTWHYQRTFNTGTHLFNTQINRWLRVSRRLAAKSFSNMTMILRTLHARPFKERKKEKESDLANYVPWPESNWTFLEYFKAEGRLTKSSWNESCVKNRKKGQTSSFRRFNRDWYHPARSKRIKSVVINKDRCTKY